METGIQVERAYELLTERVKPVGTELIPATKAHGRVLAKGVISPISQPPWPRSPLDGYAFRAEDSVGASEETPVSLKVMEMICAGDWTEREIQKGEAVRLMTGAPIPAGCDCVLRQEDTDLGSETVQIYKELKPFSNYCYAGEDFAEGEEILPVGTRLAGNAMGVLASAGLLREDVSLCVYKKVRCALICTGDELVSPTVQPLPSGKIYSSSESLLAARLAELGIELVYSKGSLDDGEALAEEIRKVAKDVDLIITTGGVSVGTKDILHEALPLLSADRIFWKVKLKPGSPLMFSFYQDVPILSLSGNPFGTGATFELFGRVLLSRLQGAEDLLMQVFPAILDTSFAKFGKGRRFVRGIFRNGHVTLPEGHSSGQLASSVGTNCLAELPPSEKPYAPGDTVTVYLL